MAYDTNPPLAQGEGSQNVRMWEGAASREVLYPYGYVEGEATEPPTLTRYHRGPWHPGHRQYVFGSQEWSMWQALHGPHTRPAPLDRTNFNRGKAKPVRIWDRAMFPASVAPRTYQANPTQQMYGNIDASGLQLPLTARGY